MTDRELLKKCAQQFRLLERLANSSHVTLVGKGRVPKHKAIAMEAKAGAEFVEDALKRLDSGSSVS